MKYKCAIVAALVIGTSNLATASLVLSGQISGSGQGHGAVLTVLVLNGKDVTGSAGQDEQMIGCVGYDGSTDTYGQNYDSAGQCTGSSSQVQTSQSQTLLFGGDFGFDSSSTGFDIGVVYNPDQEGGDIPITLNQMVLNIFAADGTSLFTATFAGPIDLSSNDLGVGNTGFLFTLDAAQAAAATAAAFGTNFSLTNRIGLSANVGCIGTVGELCEPNNNGPESFQLVNLGGMQPIPEPSSMVLLGTALLGAAAARRHKNKKTKA